MYNFAGRVIVKSEGRRNSSQGYLYSAAASGLAVVLEPPPTVCVSFLSLRSRHTALFGGHLFPESSASRSRDKAGEGRVSTGFGDQPLRQSFMQIPSWEAVAADSQQNGEVEQW